MFLISHLFGPFLGNVVPLALFILDPNPGYAVAVLAISISGFWIFPFVLRAIGHYNLLALISIQNLMFCILWSCFFYGGVTSPTLPWVLTIPLLAFFYLGSAPQLRLIVLLMFAAQFRRCSGCSRSPAARPEPKLDFAALQGLGLVSTVAASLYVTMMALFYAKVLASQGELETEMRGHLATAAELRRATEEAERAGAAKADFLAKMSHELRTPLNAVIGYSQILLEDAADEQDDETAADLERIHSAGHHLLRLVNEVLDLSKIEAGKMELHRGHDRDRLAARGCASPFRPAATRAGNTMLASAPTRSAASCDGTKLRQALLPDPRQCRQVHPWRPSITVERRRTVSRASMLGLGQGYRHRHLRQHLPTLFEHFTVGDDSSASKYGGTGLGLALGRKLCRLMGGDISSKARRGRGSTFTIWLPVAAPRNQPASRTATPAALTEPHSRTGCRHRATALSHTAAPCRTTRQSANHALRSCSSKTMK